MSYVPLPRESNGAVPVNIQDQHSQLVEFYMRRILGTTTLSANSTIGSYTVTFTAGHGATVGEVVVIKEVIHFYQAHILNVATNTITLDTPLDFAFTTAAIVQRCSMNLAVDGSTTPVVFFVTPTDLANVQIDINVVRFHIEDNVVMDSHTFGGLPELTRGIVLQVKSDITKNIFNIKSNGGFSRHCGLIEYDSKAPAGVYGFRAIKRFNGQEHSGVSIRLNSATSDEIRCIVQDDLTGLDEFYIVVSGHVVEN